MVIPEHDNDDDEFVSPEEMAEIMADLEEAGFAKNGVIDQAAIDAAPRIPFTEYYEWLDEKYGPEEEEAQEEQSSK